MIKVYIYFDTASYASYIIYLINISVYFHIWNSLIFSIIEINANEWFNINILILWDYELILIYLFI